MQPFWPLCPVNRDIPFLPGVQSGLIVYRQAEEIWPQKEGYWQLPWRLKLFAGRRVQCIHIDSVNCFHQRAIAGFCGDENRDKPVINRRAARR
jgi:hypothetical protein